MSSRFSLSLGTRIFLISGGLLLLALGSAVVLTTTLGNRIGTRAAKDRILATNSVQAAFQQQRYEQLGLLAQNLAGNPDFKAYMLDAIDRHDPASVLDQLGERQGDLHYDFAAIVDPQGGLVARTDVPNAPPGSSLAQRPLVAKAIAEYQASGVWLEGSRLYYAVAVPLSTGPNLFGYLIAGFAINDTLALEVKRITGTEVAFLAATGSGSGVSPVATTMDGPLQERLLGVLRGRGDLIPRVMQQGQAVDQTELTIDGRRWIALLAPLRDAKDQPVGSTIALASLDRELASYRQIEQLLIVVGGAALLVALALSYALSRRTFSPVRQLAAAAEAARQGNYDVKFKVGGASEVAQLGHALETLLADLRAKRDMQSYLVELSRTLPEPGRTGGASEAPEVRKLALVGIELRRYASPRVGLDPGETLERMSRDLRRISTAVVARGGHVESFSGQRVVASFEGTGRALRALGAATEIATSVAVRENAFDDAQPPVLALSAGEALSGAVSFGESTATALVGNAVQQLDSLLREATPGDILLSPAAHGELADSLREAGVQITPQRGLLSTQPLFSLSTETASKVTGVQPAQVTTLLGAAGEAPAGGARPTLAEIAPGSLLGSRFEILSVLGAGGMGVVYKARDRELDDLVALKMLKRDVAGDGALLERLKSELKLARKVTHPNILRTFDFGEVDGLPYISMEYVRGVTLRTMIEQSGRLPYSAGLTLGRQLCAGLAAAHALNIIHRDIKPENIILDQTGNAKLMDFGLARPVQRVTPGQTQAGWIVGTPHYLAPEQLEGKEVDTRADLYACGVVLYEIFTGALPFGGENPMQIILAHLNEEPTPPRRRWSGMSEKLEEIILHCLAKDPARRMPKAETLLHELEGLSA